VFQNASVSKSLDPTIVTRDKVHVHGRSDQCKSTSVEYINTGEVAEKKEPLHQTIKKRSSEESADLTIEDELAAWVNETEI
jgi:hypothetical protein